MISMMGISVTSSFGRLVARHIFSRSQRAPSKKRLFHLRLVSKFGARCIQGRLVEGPILAAARRLDQRGQKRLRNVEPGEPINLRVAVLSPRLVLLVPVTVVVDPGAERLGALRGQLEPHRVYAAVEEPVPELLEVRAHADLPGDRTFEVGQGV